jgi:hypothetical protein
MNKEVINAVADAIARGELVEHGIGFNMATWNSGLDISTYVDQTGGGCGTVACIAGWTSQMFDGNGNRLELDGPLLRTSSDIIDTARDAMGLTWEQADDLFVPWASRSVLSQVTNCEAVGVLRKLAETGEVDWAPVLQRIRSGGGF